MIAWFTNKSRGRYELCTKKVVSKVGEIPIQELNQGARQGVVYCNHAISCIARKILVKSRSGGSFRQRKKASEYGRRL